MDLRTASGVHLADAPAAANGLPRWLTYVRMSDVRAADRNPKMHDKGIKEAILTFGFADPPEVDERTGQLVAGHGRIAALVTIRQEGYNAPAGIVVDDDGEWLIPLYRGWSSRTDAEAEAYGVAQNMLPGKGGFHNKTLAQVLEDVTTEDPGLLDTMSVTSDDLDDLLRRHDPDRDPAEPRDAGLDGGGEVGGDAPLGQDGDSELDGDAPPSSVVCPACAHRFPLAPGR